MSARDDRPTTGRPTDFAAFFVIVTHPAFRLGLLDAQAGRPPDHDRILRRIANETPARALERLGWSERAGMRLDLGGEDISKETSLAQYRYEEGRQIHVECGVRCKAWGHPDFPPAQVIRYILDRLATLKADGSAGGA